MISIVFSQYMCVSFFAEQQLENRRNPVEVMPVWGIMYIYRINSVENNRRMTERRRKMNSFFEDLGKKISETTETVTSKAEEMMEIQRLKGQIRTLERGNDADLLAMGRFLYEKYQAGEVMEEEVQTLCEKIDQRTESMEKHQAKIETIKGTTSCTNCGKQVAKEMAYCPYCGAKKEPDIWEETGDVLKEKAEQAVEFVKEKVKDE